MSASPQGKNVDQVPTVIGNDVAVRQIDKKHNVDREQELAVTSRVRVTSEFHRKSIDP